MKTDIPENHEAMEALPCAVWTPNGITYIDGSTHKRYLCADLSDADGLIECGDYSEWCSNTTGAVCDDDGETGEVQFVVKIDDNDPPRRFVSVTWRTGASGTAGFDFYEDGRIAQHDVEFDPRVYDGDAADEAREMLRSQAGDATVTGRRRYGHDGSANLDPIGSADRLRIT